MAAHPIGTKVRISEKSRSQHAGLSGTITDSRMSNRPGFEPKAYNYVVMIKSTGKNVRISGENLVVISKEEFDKDDPGQQPLFYVVHTTGDGRRNVSEPFDLNTAKKEATDYKTAYPLNKVEIVQVILEAQSPRIIVDLNPR
ncbi:MAG: hypothetical protein ACRDCE_18940 [Cetobacterium sp.]|uniref:hypothetical protein n=1 Tax=Cetobacterium sp. TaxID=2071632 RepID=UPI003EE49CF6